MDNRTQNDEPVFRFQRVTLRAGTVVRIGAIPFYLAENTIVEGHPNNVEMLTVEHPSVALPDEPSRERGA